MIASLITFLVNCVGLALLFYLLKLAFKYHLIFPDNEIVTIRHFKDIKHWFIANARLTDIRESYASGILLNAKLNPQDEVMYGYCCDSSAVSEATASGILRPLRIPRESKIKRRCKVAFSPERKVFFNQENPSEILTEVPILALYPDGSSEAIWTTKAA